MSMRREKHAAERKEKNMLNIIKSGKPDGTELTKQDLYYLTKAPNAQKMSFADGSKLDIYAWCIYTDKTEDGDEREIFALRTPDGEVFVTNSPTFIKSIYDILDVFDASEFKAILVCSAQSKAGRTFYTAVYAG